MRIFCNDHWLFIGGGGGGGSVVPTPVPTSTHTVAPTATSTSSSTSTATATATPRPTRTPTPAPTTYTYTVSGQISGSIEGSNSIYVGLSYHNTIGESGPDFFVTAEVNSSPVPASYSFTFDSSSSSATVYAMALQYVSSTEGNWGAYGGFDVLYRMAGSITVTKTNPSVTGKNITMVPIPISTPTEIPTPTPSSTTTSTPSPTPSSTSTASPTGTASATPTATPTLTPTPTETASATPTASPTTTPTTTPTETSSPTATPTPTPTEKTIVPIFSDTTVSHEAKSVSVQISAAGGADIYYTTNGNSPTINSTHYTGIFTIESSTLVKAIATKEGYINSDISSQQYDIYWWQALGPGMKFPSVVNSIAVNNSDLYAGGGFYFDGGTGISAQNLAKWDGSNWTSVGGGSPDNRVRALLLDGTNLFAAGEFSSLGGVSWTEFIAKYNTLGSAWSSLGNVRIQMMSSVIDAMAFDGTNLYVGETGGSYIAGAPFAFFTKWDGTGWSTLGTGPNDSVLCLANVNSDIYAGGRFTTASGVTVNHVAKFDGSSWSALGEGMNGPVSSLIVCGSDIYVGGAFTLADGNPANNIAKWNGTSWSPLGDGVNGSVNALAAYGSDIYAGGTFSTAGGSLASNIAKWDGTSWESVGDGMFSPVNPSIVNALAINGSDLYAGGDFDSAGGVGNTHYIAKWKIPGPLQTPLPTPTPTPGPTFSISGNISNNNDGGSTYFVGAFTRSTIDCHGAPGYINPDPVAAIVGAYNNGSSYTLNLPGTGEYWIFGYVSGTVDYYGAYGGESFLSLNYYTMLGSVEITGPTHTTGIDIIANPSSKNAAPIFSNTTVSQDANTFTVEITAESGTSIYYSIDGSIPTSSSHLYTGVFTIEVSTLVKAIAIKHGYMNSDVASQQYDLDWWQALAPWPNCVNSTVNALAFDGSDLYAGGVFTTAGESSVNYVAKWDGSNWSGLGGGLSGGYSWDMSVNALVYDGTHSCLYVGGKFPNAGEIAVNNIAKWNGTSWEALSDGVNDVVYSLATDGTNLYAGVAGSPVLKWDGTTWEALGGSHVPVGVRALYYDSTDNLLYAAGFVGATSGVSQWNGSTWSTVTTFDGAVFALAYDGTNLFAGGNFTTAGGNSANRVAKQNGATWEALGTGLTGTYTVNSLATDGNNLFVGYGGSQFCKWNGATWEAFDMDGVYSLVFNGADLYVGGYFISAPGAPDAVHIAKWGKKI